MAKFVDPLDEEADAAGAASVEKHGAKLAERMSSKPVDDETEEVTVQEPEEPEDDDEDEAKPTRRDKRSNRMSARERAAAEKARADTLAEQLEITRRTQAERGEPARAPVNPAAEIDRRIRGVFDRQKQLHEQYNAAKGLTPAQEKEYFDRAADLEVEKTSLIAERRDVLTAPERQRKAHLDMLASRNPDVYQNPRAFQYAQAVYNQHLAKGEADTIELHDMAMEEARQAILGKRPKPDAGQKQRAAGIGGAGARASAGPEAAPRISMPKGSALWRMAVARYPDLEPAEACQKWANKNGKDYVKLASRRG